MGRVSYSRRIVFRVPSNSVFPNVHAPSRQVGRASIRDIAKFDSDGAAVIDPEVEFEPLIAFIALAAILLLEFSVGRPQLVSKGGTKDECHDEKDALHHFVVAAERVVLVLLSVL